MQIQPEPTPDASVARIPARSRRVAMDWGLVLASQGIQAVIEKDPERGWSLVVATADHLRAVEVIRLYRKENLRWPWLRRVLKQDYIFDWAAAVYVVLIGVFQYLASLQSSLTDAGLMDTELFAQGQWWRPFTAVWLHANYAHLAANAGFGFVLLGLALGRYGTGLGLLAAYLAGVTGNLADWAVYGAGHHSLGASGMVMGGLGLLAVQSYALRHELVHVRKIIIGGIAGGVMLFALLGLSPDSDVVAHLGGFVGGVALGGLLALRPRLARNEPANLAAGLVFAGLVIWPWRLAIMSLR